MQDAATTSAGQTVEDRQIPANALIVSLAWYGCHIASLWLAEICGSIILPLMPKLQGCSWTSVLERAPMCHADIMYPHSKIVHLPSIEDIQSREISEEELQTAMRAAFVAQEPKSDLQQQIMHEVGAENLSCLELTLVRRGVECGPRWRAMYESHIKVRLCASLYY